MKTNKISKQPSSIEPQSKDRDLLSELNIAYEKIANQIIETKKREEELKIANKELHYQQREKANRASELAIANKELVYQTKEKKNRASELIIANKELIYQTKEKKKRAAELVIANKELAYQTKEKKDRAAELVIANKELHYQQSEKSDRASELDIANKELIYQTIEKKNRADELAVANKELHFQQGEKADRASELAIANKERIFQKSEKVKRAHELKIANKELAYQTIEKANRASELVIIKKAMIDQEVRIENLSYSNELSEQFSRKYFLDTIKSYDLEFNLPLSIILGNINGLALIDNSFGHTTVDDVQVRLNKILKKIARRNDLIICFNNGEFSLVLPKTTYINAKRIIEKIQILSKNEESIPLNISLSCGAYTKTSIEIDLEDTIKKAILQLNKDKKMVRPIFENNTINLIMKMLFEKNMREMMHSSRVSDICVKIATRLNFDPAVIERIRLTGMLHDIGKIGIDEDILNKAEKLDTYERNEIKKHPEIGYRILSASNDFIKYADDILEHHERVDGKGYPKGLKGDEISIVAKIIAIADTYDALISDRPYRKAMCQEDAIVEIQRCSGSQFDSGIDKVFVDMITDKSVLN